MLLSANGCLVLHKILVKRTREAIQWYRNSAIVGSAAKMFRMEADTTRSSTVHMGRDVCSILSLCVLHQRFVPSSAEL